MLQCDLIAQLPKLQIQTLYTVLLLKVVIKLNPRLINSFEKCPK